MMIHSVLFVDDEVELSSSIMRSLRNAPYTVETAVYGEQALKKLMTDQISVVISDMRMLDMNGNEFLDQAQKVCPDAVYMVLSAYSDIDSVMRAVNEQHVWRYITKPWQKEDLKLAIKNAIEIFEYRKAKKNLVIQLENKNRQLNELNSILEEKVRKRTKQLKSKNEILQMLVEDVDINNILKKACMAISEQHQVKSVYINVPFLNSTITNSTRKITKNITKILEECNRERKEIIKKTGIGIPLLKNDLFLGTILIGSKKCLNESFADKDDSFISTTIICLMHAWNLHKMDELLNELNYNQ